MNTEPPQIQEEFEESKLSARMNGKDKFWAQQQEQHRTPVTQRIPFCNWGRLCTVDDFWRHRVDNQTGQDEVE